MRFAQKIKTIFLTFFLATSIAFATNDSDNPYEISAFDDKAPLTRGSLYPNYTEALQLGNKGACSLVKKLWGWTDANCLHMDKILLNAAPNIDTLVFAKPNAEGYVEYDDWHEKDRDESIAEIVRLIKLQFKVQGKRVNKKMEWVKWLIYPTLVENKNYMYYAYLSKIDGEESLTIESALYDRKGYVQIQLVPKNLTAASSESEFRETLESALDLYTSDIGERYADYSQGDKIYKYGIIGSLAALAGVSWKGKGKAVVAGIFATILIFAKKLWWLIFVPFILIFKKLFKKKD